VSSPLSERSNWLLDHIAPGNGVRIVEHVDMHGKAVKRCFTSSSNTIRQSGIVAKRLDAPAGSRRGSRSRTRSIHGAVPPSGREAEAHGGACENRAFRQ
jgi:hypothetical protein